MLEKGRDFTGTRYCVRGLENKTKQAQRARTNKRREIYDTVLDEQDEQYEQDAYDDEVLADIYREATMSCQIRAHVVGMEDQREAELIYVEDEETLAQCRLLLE
jgi:hypothetical protein